MSESHHVTDLKRALERRCQENKDLRADLRIALDEWDRGECTSHEFAGHIRAVLIGKTLACTRAADRDSQKPLTKEEINTLGDRALHAVSETGPSVRAAVVRLAKAASAVTLERDRYAAELKHVAGSATGVSEFEPYRVRITICEFNGRAPGYRPALDALRDVLGISLKEARDAIENDFVTFPNEQAFQSFAALLSSNCQTKRLGMCCADREPPAMSWFEIESVKEGERSEACKDYDPAKMTEFRQTLTKLFQEDEIEPVKEGGS